MCAKDEILERIRKSRKESIFFISDFCKNGNDVFVSRLLSELVAEGVIARLGNGVFYKPIKTQFGELMPSVDAVAKAIARRDKAQIMPTGETAEHLLGLSTQVPMNYVYLTTGSARKITLGDITITFKRSVPKNFAFKGSFMPTLVQAMKSIGKDNITETHLVQIKRLIQEHPEPNTFTHDLALAPIWIKKLIK